MWRVQQVTDTEDSNAAADLEKECVGYQQPVDEYLVDNTHSQLLLSWTKKKLNKQINIIFDSKPEHIGGVDIKDPLGLSRDVVELIIDIGVKIPFYK